MQMVMKTDNTIIKVEW